MRNHLSSGNLITVLFTLLIVTLLILSGPVKAIEVNVKTDKTTYGGNDLAVITASVDVQTDERIPVQNVTIIISNSSSDVVRSCTFTLGGSNLTACANIVSITVLRAINSSNATRHFGYGYGYSSGTWGYGNQTFYNGSYGYGYGYTPGYTGYSGELSFNITWNVSAESINDGNYTVDLWAHASDALGKSRIYSDATPTTGDNSFEVDKTAPSVTVTGPTGTVTSSSTTLTATTNENAQCRYSTSDTTFSEMSSATQTDLDTSHSWTLSSLTSGTKTYYIRCQDAHSNVASTSQSARFTVSITTSTGGGGGGGAPSNVEGSTSHAWYSIAAGTPTSMTVTNTDISFTGIEFELSSEASNPSLTVNSLINKPTSIPTAPSETVYQYVEVVASNLKDVASVTVDFQVPLSWLTENGMTASEISLYRWIDGNWVELPTIVVTSDATNIYFQATSPGFSYFAVGMKSVVALEPPEEVLPPTTRVIKEPTSEPGALPQEPLRPTITVEEQKTIGWMILFIVIISIALFVVSYEFFKKRLAPRLEKDAKKYIERSRAMGKSDKEIEAALKTANWPDKKIDKLLKK